MCEDWVKEATTDQEKAEVLSNFFSQVLIDEENDNYLPLRNNPVPTTLDNIAIHINEDTILKKLKDLKPDKSPRPDNIFPKALKQAAHQLASPLKLIFQHSLDTTKVPDAWKIGHIRAIHKKRTQKTVRKLQTHKSHVSCVQIIGIHNPGQDH